MKVEPGKKNGIKEAGWEGGEKGLETLRGKIYHGSRLGLGGLGFSLRSSSCEGCICHFCQYSQKDESRENSSHERDELDSTV